MTLSMTAVMLFKIIKSILLIYVALLLLMYFLQRSMIYLPTPITQHPYTDWVISHNEGIVEAILTRKNQQQAITYLCGNAEKDDVHKPTGSAGGPPAAQHDLSKSQQSRGWHAI